jgi:putative Holliday junction resolvase
MSIESSKNANMSHFLGIDFGKAKIGLAVADSETRIAFGYGVLKNDKDLIENLKNIIEKEEINKIIVGDSSSISSPPAKEGIRGVVCPARLKPLRPSGTSPWQGRRFGELLEEKLNIPIEFQNELFSTQQAERNLKEKGAKKIKRFDDQEAARIILQSWLEKK